VTHPVVFEALQSNPTDTSPPDFGSDYHDILPVSRLVTLAQSADQRFIDLNLT
jgi:hypothetical protein